MFIFLVSDDDLSGQGIYIMLCYFSHLLEWTRVQLCGILIKSVTRAIFISKNYGLYIIGKENEAPTSNGLHAPVPAEVSVNHDEPRKQSAV